jgi:5-methylcytosine-specific restriction endonuclease McrA
MTQYFICSDGYHLYYEDDEPPRFLEMSEETNNNSFIQPSGYGSWGELEDELIANRWCLSTHQPKRPPEYFGERLKNTQLGRILQQNVRADRRDLPATLTLEEWWKICNSFRYCCAYCGITKDENALCVEHFVPIHSGGGTELRNIVPSCRRCNSKKRYRDPDEFISGLPDATKIYARIAESRKRLGI